jgi:hypothetical protein
MVLLGEHPVNGGEEKDRISLLKTALLNTIFCAGSFYSVWFWFKGVHWYFAPTPGSCGTYGLVFTKVSLFNPPVFKAMQALSVLAALFGGVGQIYMWYMFIKILFGAKERGLRQSTSLVVATAPGPVQSTIPSEFKFTSRGCACRLVLLYPPLLPIKLIFVHSGDLTPIMGLLVFVHSVVGIELTLYWNQVTDVYTIKSIGQLIPFIIGIEEIIRFTYRAYKEVTSNHGY